MTNPLIRFMLLLFAFSLLSACQSAHIIGSNLPTEADQLERWQIKGRIGFSNGDDGGSAHLLWQQDSLHSGELDLSGPIGIGHAKITYSNNGAMLDNGKQQVTAANPSLLAFRLTGLMLPIPALSWWVRGLPWPDAPIKAQQRNDEGQLVTLSQAGWHLTFDRYKGEQQLVLPGRIKATQQRSRFTLLISSWTL